MADRSERQAWAKENMKGIENQLMPSFTPDLSELDERGVRWDVQKTKEHGFFSTLCTCEAALSFEEAKRFVEIVADEAGEDLHVATTLVFDSFEQNLEMLEHAARVGADSALLGYPLNWYPDDPGEIYERTRELADATDLSIVLYISNKFNFERFHPAGFPMDLLDRLADIENVVAVKVSNPQLLADIHRICGDRLLLSNPIEGFLPNHIVAFDMQWIGAGPYEIYQTPDQPLFTDYFAALREGRWEEGMKTYYRLTPIREIFFMQMQPQLMVGTYHWPQHKFYQWLVGGNGGFTRQPAMKLAVHEREMVRVALRRAGLEPRENDAEFFVGRVNYEASAAGVS